MDITWEFDGKLYQVDFVRGEYDPSTGLNGGADEISVTRIWHNDTAPWGFLGLVDCLECFPQSEQHKIIQAASEYVWDYCDSAGEADYHGF